MNAKYLIFPLFMAGAFVMGCDKKESPAADVNAAETKAAVDKTAADTKAVADKNAADAKASADKAATNAQAAGVKDSADAKAADAKALADKTAEAAKSTADTKAASDKATADKAAADALQEQTSKLLADLKTDITDKKWADADAIVKQLDAVRDRLPAGQSASFDSLKKQYEDNKQ
jgi:hypothetical protein